MFGRYRLHEKIEGCPCCVNAKDNRALRSKRLRNLTAEDLGLYAWKAMTTWGSEEDFKHFLPRLAELYAGGSLAGFCDDEMFGSKLHFARWLSWRVREVNAVRAFLRAWLDDRLGRKPEEKEVGECLASIALAENEIGPYLKAWWRAEGSTAVRQFEAFAYSNARSLNKTRELGIWWQETGANQQEAVRWMLSKGWADRLEAESVAHANEPWAERMMQTAAWIRAIA